MEAEARANLRRVELQLIQERELAKQAKLEWGDRDWKPGFRFGEANTPDRKSRGGNPSSRGKTDPGDSRFEPIPGKGSLHGQNFKNDGRCGAAGGFGCFRCSCGDLCTRFGRDQSGTQPFGNELSWICGRI